MYLSIAAGIATILLKFAAYRVTGSIGFFSDALESIVNLLAASFGLVMLHVSEKPADEGHEFGHSKAEYFSSAIEGSLILLAAFSIIWSAIPRLMHPIALENINIGLLFSIGASLVNLAVGQVLIHNGKKNKSLLVEADGKHLMTDVWTSAGVIAGILLVKFTGILILDPIIAILVALNIVYTGYHLISRSTNGLMDASISETEINQVKKYLDGLKEKNITYHSLMTRQAGQRKFISFHLLVPGAWTVQQGHENADIIEETIEDMFDEPVTVTSHIEPVEDPASLKDIGIDRKKNSQKDCTH